MKLVRKIIFVALLLGVASALRAAAPKDPFAEFIRSSDPRTPADELKGFHVPPGFEVQLVASEPEIGKPMNMAFDARGRLWITQSREYPFPAPKDRKGRDVIKVLEDTDGDGHADKITTFAEGLNIPIGLYPYRNGVIAFSIPNVSFYEDTDGDGKADKQQLLYGPFGFDKDTHGLTSNFRRGFDGWIYACHGFNNTTTIKGADGEAITMNSGNTYRMKLDGSHVEYFTHGQVNPFGLMFDPLGNLYSADCHSSPIYQLQRGGYYPSFGKPDDGLGFAPIMMSHSHGSTAIGGIVFYADQNFPPEFQSNIFVGNVMTCRINRDRLEDHGSTRLAREETDLLRSDDPWFRPVDLQLGPDGAVYVADFYNRIIGHYEVPLDHPGRDRERGRIWRIVYRGDAAKSPPTRHIDYHHASADQLIEALGDAHFTSRMLAMNELVDQLGTTALPALRKAFNSAQNSFQKLHSLWALRRCGDKTESILQKAASDKDPLVRAHSMRVLSESASFSEVERKLALAGLKDADAFVQRDAAEALGQHPAFENVGPLVALRQNAPQDDTHLLYVVRMALRNQLLSAPVMQRVAAAKWSEKERRTLADVAVAAPSAEAAGFLMAYIEKYDEPRETTSRYLKQIVRYIPTDQIDPLGRFVRRKFADDLDLQTTLFKSLQDGIAQRGANIGQETRTWGVQLAEKLLKTAPEAMTWLNTPLEGGATANPWVVQSRKSSDGKTDAFLCSLPNGEQLTGVLRSPTFSIPARLTFFLAGHDGFPDKPINKKNLVRLCLAADHTMVMQTSPPRNDTAQKISWDLSQHSGQQGYFELVDRDTAGAYAWLAAGRFDPPVVRVPAANPSQISQRQLTGADLARTLKAAELQTDLQGLFTGKNIELEPRAAAARALAAIAPMAALPLLARSLNDADESMAFRERVAQALSEAKSDQAAAELVNSLRTAPHRLEVKLAQALASTPEGAEQLLGSIEARKASPQLLMEKSVRERLLASKAKDWEKRAAALTKGVPALDAERQKLIDQRRAGFKIATAKASAGAKVFEQNCAVCHQIDGKGGVIGPQLEGVGNRGAERIIEDILDPNRNVDSAFRYSTITLDDERVITGLQRREEGAVLIFADATGKEISVPKKQIKERIQSESSLMPDNFGEIISAEDFNNLISFLLSKGLKSAAHN